MHEVGRVLERQRRRSLVEVVQQLDLRQRQLERADRLEQVGVAVLVQVDDHREQVTGELPSRDRTGIRCLRACRYYLHARKYCTRGP